MNKQLAKIFMKTAFEFAGLSKCVSHQVGCVAVKNNRIIATGVNGTAPGYYNCNDLFNDYYDRKDHHEFSEQYEIHAEMNMVLYSVKEGISLNDASVFVTLHPCWNCIKHLSVIGIKEIWYYNMYDFMHIDINKINFYCERVGLSIKSYQDRFGTL